MAKWICIIDSVEQTINGNKYLTVLLFFFHLSLQLLDLIVLLNWQLTFEEENKKMNNEIEMDKRQISWNFFNIIASFDKVRQFLNRIWADSFHWFSSWTTFLLNVIFAFYRNDSVWFDSWIFVVEICSLNWILFSLSFRSPRYLPCI